MKLLTLLLVATELVAGCAELENVEPSSDTSLCERLKPAGSECATVYEFAEPASNELGHVEMCVPDRYLEEAESLHGLARPSTDPRFTKYTDGLVRPPPPFPPCWWQCPATVEGCNAYDTCYVPIGGCPAP